MTTGKSSTTASSVLADIVTGASRGISRVIASLAATLSVVTFDVPVWAMFVGWISSFTRGLNLKQGAINLGDIGAGGDAGTHSRLSCALAAKAHSAPCRVASVFPLNVRSLTDLVAFASNPRTI